jgi:hypothetical protein
MSFLYNVILASIAWAEPAALPPSGRRRRLVAMLTSLPIGGGKERTV